MILKEKVQAMRYLTESVNNRYFGIGIVCSKFSHNINPRVCFHAPSVRVYTRASTEAKNDLSWVFTVLLVLVTIVDLEVDPVICLIVNINIITYLQLSTPTSHQDLQLYDKISSKLTATIIATPLIVITSKINTEASYTTIARAAVIKKERYSPCLGCVAELPTMS